MPCSRTRVVAGGDLHHDAVDAALGRPLHVDDAPSNSSADQCPSPSRARKRTTRTCRPPGRFGGSLTTALSPGGEDTCASRPHSRPMLQIPGATVASVAFTPAGIVLGLRLRRKKLRCPCGHETRSVYARCRPGVSRSAAGAMDRAAVPAGPAEAGPAASARVAEEAEARAPARDERLPAAGSW